MLEQSPLLYSFWTCSAVAQFIRYRALVRALACLLPLLPV